MFVQLARFALRRLRGEAPAGVAPAIPRRRRALERSGIVIAPGQLRRYLRATGAERMRALAGDGAVLPPLYPVVWQAPLILELLAEADPGLPLAGLIHLEGEAVRVRPLRPDDQVRCRVELDRAEPHPRGVRYRLVARHWNGAGQLCAEDTLTVLAPTSPGGYVRRPRSEPPEPPPAGAEWRDVAQWKLSSAAGRRYARASGDFNPIHLWGWTARPFGFRRPILHGFCTEALVAHALIEHRWEGDPAALRRLRIRFRVPLALPCRVVLRVAEGERGGRFRVAGADGTTFAEGEFGGG